MTAQTKTLGRLCDQAAVRQLQLDDVKITYIVDGAMAMNTEHFSVSVPAGHWAEHPDELDAQHRIPMSTGGLLIERNGFRLLIDAGLGDINVDVGGFGSGNSGDFLTTLAAAGVEPENIDLFAFTHLHGDHIGWAFTDDETRGPQPTFPNAPYLLSEAEWSAAQNAAGGGPYSALDGSSIIEPLRKSMKLRLIRDGDEITPGVVALVTPGHTPGHTSYIVTSQAGNRLVAFGDVFHMPAQISHTRWTSAPDTDPATVPSARARILSELQQTNTFGFGFHFGDQPFGQVLQDGETLSWRPVPSTVLLRPSRAC